MQEIIRDKLVTELIINNFILKYSDIIIHVVGKLNMYDQLEINRLKHYEGNIDTVFVIHNLYNFTKKKDIEVYIENVLYKSIYNENFGKFEIPNLDNDNNNVDNYNVNRYYYREIIRKINSDDCLTMIHIIMGNDNDDSEAKKLYNEPAIKFLRNSISGALSYKNLDIIYDVKKFISDYSPKIMEMNKEENDKLKNQREYEYEIINQLIK